MPRRVADFLNKCRDWGLSEASRPKVDPLLVVQEELPVADDSVPHEQKRHRWLEWSEARVVDRGVLVAFVERSEQDSVVHVRPNCKLLEDVAEDSLRTISRQVGEDNDDDLVLRVLAVRWLSVQEQALVAVHQLDNTLGVPVG